MRLNNIHQKSTQKAFTLIELIMVIVLLGVMAVGISGFLGLSSQTFVNISERDELLNSARFVVERLNREIRNAVPNSVRLATAPDNSIQCVEFIPIKASTFYTDIPVLPESKTVNLKVVKFVDQQGNDYSCTPFCLDYVSVYPLKESDLYTLKFNGTGRTYGLDNFIAPVGSDEWTLKVDKPLIPAGNTGVQFDQDSPTKRLYIFQSPVSYCVNNKQVIRYANGGLSSVPLTTPTSSSSLMAENHASLKSDGSNLPFKIQPATLKRNALLQVNLTFEREDELISFNQQIHINNIP